MFIFTHVSFVFYGSLFFRLILVAIVLSNSVLLSGCYYLESAFNHVKIMSDRQLIEKALTSDLNLTQKERDRLLLSKKLTAFIKDSLKLNMHGNYKSYVNLNRPYVSYLLTVANKNKLELYEWNYPVVGRLPYKGFFKLEDAKNEEKKFIEKNFDTYIRGVSAYSTLGWFEDPILSTMLEGEEHHFVDTIIHETIHANLFIKNDGLFNEQVAIFFGSWGTSLFYDYLNNGKKSEISKIILEEIEDKKKFSEFVSKTRNELVEWYNSLDPKLEEFSFLKERSVKFDQIISEFSLMQTTMKRLKFNSFKEAGLNNAKFMAYGTYYQNIDQFYKFRDRKNMSFDEYFLYLKKNAHVSSPINLINEM